jgi:predicted membrane protein
MLLLFLLIGLVATILSFVIPSWRHHELWPYTVLIPIVAGTTWQLVFRTVLSLFARFLPPVISGGTVFGLSIVLVCSLPGAALAFLFVRWLRRERRAQRADV